MRRFISSILICSLVTLEVQGAGTVSAVGSMTSHFNGAAIDLVNSAAFSARLLEAPLFWHISWTARRFHASVLHRLRSRVSHGPSYGWTMLFSGSAQSSSFGAFSDDMSLQSLREEFLADAQTSALNAALLRATPAVLVGTAWATHWIAHGQPVLLGLSYLLGALSLGAGILNWRSVRELRAVKTYFLAQAETTLRLQNFGVQTLGEWRERFARESGTAEPPDRDYGTHRFRSGWVVDGKASTPLATAYSESEVQLFRWILWAGGVSDRSMRDQFTEQFRASPSLSRKRDLVWAERIRLLTLLHFALAPVLVLGDLVKLMVALYRHHLDPVSFFRGLLFVFVAFAIVTALHELGHALAIVAMKKRPQAFSAVLITGSVFLPGSLSLRPGQGIALSLSGPGVNLLTWMGCLVMLAYYALPWTPALHHDTRFLLNALFQGSVWVIYENMHLSRRWSDGFNALWNLVGRLTGVEASVLPMAPPNGFRMSVLPWLPHSLASAS